MVLLSADCCEKLVNIATPPPPGRFSMMEFQPVCSLNTSSRIQPIVSVEPPAPKPIWIVMGLPGSQPRPTTGALDAIKAAVASPLRLLFLSISLLISVGQLLVLFYGQTFDRACAQAFDLGQKAVCIDHHIGITFCAFGHGLTVLIKTI